MSDLILQIPMPSVSPLATLRFLNGRPAHYLMLEFHAPDLSASLHSAFFHVCQSMTCGLQERASSAYDGGGVLFPEPRTWEDWHGLFLWEFWLQEKEWDVPRLWDAIDGDTRWFEATFAKGMATW